MDIRNLDNLLQPKSVAIVGASTQPGKIGYTVIENLIKGDYKGKIYPINPTASEILGFKVYPNIAAVPDSVDLAVITVPVKLVCQVVEECGQKGILALSVITSGFSEAPQGFGTGINRHRAPLPYVRSGSQHRRYALKF